MVRGTAPGEFSQSHPINFPDNLASVQDPGNGQYRNQSPS